ncbi:MAG: hypothetical protein KHX49_03865 [Lachnospiraceae bacterium]|nr:hypothetical protein [Lachnospiraceae bacterium]
MIPFQFNKKSPKEKNACVEEYQVRLLARAKKEKVRELDWWCYNHLRYTFDQIIKMPYEELADLREELYFRKVELPAHLKKYMIETLYKKHVPREYLIDCLGVTVCPYCNRAYINKISTHTVCQLDHFFDKSAYPIMAVSFYNLVPVCGTCNLIKKGQEISYSPYDERFDSADQLVEFGYLTDEEKALSGMKKVDAITICGKEKCAKDNIQKLKLEEIYQIHSDIVQELLYKKKAYPKGYIDYLRRLCAGMRIDPGRLIIGNYTTPDSYEKRPLSKMMTDIGKKAGLLD